MTRIELDTVQKNRNASEWRYIGRASCQIPSGETLESVGDGQNIKLLCRDLVAEGVTGAAEVYRSGTPVFSQPIDIEAFAKGTWGKGGQPEHLMKGKP